MVSFLFFSICVSCALISKKVYHSFFTPFSIFMCIFSLAFGVLFGASFIDSALIKDSFAFAYFLSFAFFALGTFISHMLQKKGAKAINKKEITDKTYKRIILFLLIISVISTGIYWFYYIRVFGTSNFFANLLLAGGTKEGIGIPNIVLYLRMTVVFLSPFVCFYMAKHKDYSFKYVAIVIFTIISSLAYTRMTLFYIVILDALVFVFSFNRNGKASLKKRLIGISIMIVVILLLFIFFAATQKMFNKESTANVDLFGNSVNGPLVSVVSYFCGPLVSSSIYASDLSGVPFLGYTFRMLRSFLNVLGFNLDSASYFPDYWVYIPFQFNTATLQFYVYGEGGLLWVCLFYFGIGFLSNKLFEDFMKNKDTVTMMALAFVSLVLLLSIREYLLTRLDMLIYLALIVVILFFRRSASTKAA